MGLQRKRPAERAWGDKHVFNWLRLLAFSAVTALVVLPSSAGSDGRREARLLSISTWRCGAGCEDACRGFQDYFRDNKIPATFTVRDAGRDKAKLAGVSSRRPGASKADLVVTWGTSVTRIMLGPWDTARIRQNTSPRFPRFS